MKKYIAEMLGTFVLVFCGCGAVVFSATTVGNLGIAFAFGLALMAMVYAIGPISGAHVNPAVTFGVFCAGRMSGKHALGYIIFQFIGAIAAAYALLKVAEGKLYGYDAAFDGLGQNGWGFGYAGGYDMISAIIFEAVATFIFVKVILRVTKQDLKIAGVVIGLTLTLVHIVGLQITGTSVNPARSFGPALVVGGRALAQVWLFLVVPTLAGILAGLTSRCCCCKCCCEGGECTCGDDCDCGPDCKCGCQEKKAKKVEAKAENKVVAVKAEKPVAKKAPAKKAPAKKAAKKPVAKKK